jgi:Lar family restriction alleviation protein
MNNLELKPCPFCGNDKPNLIETCMDDPAWTMATIKCRKCGAGSNKAHRTTESALEWWNGRITETRIAELEAALEGIIIYAESYARMINVQPECIQSARDALAKETT